MHTAIEAVAVAYLAADRARVAARIGACLAADDYARLAARCLGMLQPAAVHHHLDLVAVPEDQLPEDCDSALPLLHSLQTPRALVDPRPQLLEIQCRKTSDLAAAEFVERVEAVASRFLRTPPRQITVDSSHASSPHIGRQLRRQ